RMLRGLAYYHSTGDKSDPRRGALLAHIARCADEETTAGRARSAVKLTRGGLTYEPSNAMIRAAPDRARHAIAARILEHAESARRRGAKGAELYDLSLARFIWPAQPGASERMATLASELASGSVFHARLRVTTDASASSLPTALVVQRVR